MARGKKEEAQRYKDIELKDLEELQLSIPSEKTAQFPNSQILQEKVNEIKDFFLQELERRDEKEIASLTIQVHDKIKALENEFFEQADKIDTQLKKVAEELSIDIDAVHLEEQKHPSLPQLSHYEELVQVNVVEQIGMVGIAKRIFGKILNKDKWGYKDRESVQTCVDRGALKEDLLDYHSIYTLKLSNYLKSWKIHWVNSVAAILSAIVQKRDDLNRKPVDIDPEPYRHFLSNIRDCRNWFETQLQIGNQSRFTMGFATVRKLKKTHVAMTEQTKKQVSLFMPLLQSARILNFARKSHRFLYMLEMLTAKKKNQFIVVSTPFSQETFDYFAMIGDLPRVEEDQFLQHPVVYSAKEFDLPVTSVQVLQFNQFPEESREAWLVGDKTIVLLHDNLLFSDPRQTLLQYFLSQADVIFRVVDLHQIGHEKKRLEELPGREMLERASDKLGYIGMGAQQLVKSGQTIDIIKSYTSLEKAPGFGPHPILLAEGEELLTSLVWLSQGLGRENTVTDELEALDILTKTQAAFIRGKERFIRNFFLEIKEFKRECQFMQELTE